MNAPQQPTTNAAARESLDRIVAHIQCRLAGRVREFQLLVRDEGLVLRGRAFTYHAKQLAQHAVMDATRMPICANEIEVI